MSTNQERRAEARQRLREQMEAQARREKQLKIAGAAAVVIVLLGLVGVVVWNKQQEARAEEHAANWIACDYPAETEVPEKVDLKEAEAQGGKEAVEQAKTFNERVETIAEKKRDGQAPTGEQPRRGTAEITLALGQGDVPLTLDRAKAPCNVASFVALTEQGYFDDAPCHRLTVAEGEGPGLSVLQCGDPTGTGMSGPGYTIVDEPPTDLPVSQDGSGSSIYPRGTVAMAKTQNPNSAGSQFFLVYEETTLPPQYTVMGTIGDAGLEVIDGIAKAGIKSKEQTDPDYEVPKKPVVIESATVVSQEGLPEAS